MTGNTTEPGPYDQEFEENRGWLRYFERGRQGWPTASIEGGRVGRGY